jgi:hypothetical protein
MIGEKTHEKPGRGLDFLQPWRTFAAMQKINAHAAPTRHEPVPAPSPASG